MMWCHFHILKMIGVNIEAINFYSCYLWLHNSFSPWIFRGQFDIETHDSTSGLRSQGKPVWEHNRLYASFLYTSIALKQKCSTFMVEMLSGWDIIHSKIDTAKSICTLKVHLNFFAFFFIFLRVLNFTTLLNNSIAHLCMLYSITFKFYQVRIKTRCIIFE